MGRGGTAKREACRGRFGKHIKTYQLYDSIYVFCFSYCLCFYHVSSVSSGLMTREFSRSPHGRYLPVMDLSRVVSVEARAGFGSPNLTWEQAVAKLQEATRQEARGQAAARTA